MSEFEKIYADYFLDVYRYLLAITRDAGMAEDLTQQTFLKALKSIDQFKGDCKLLVWLCQIAKNAYYSQYAKGKRIDPDAALDSLPDEKSIEECLADKDAAFQINKLLHEMEEPYKEVFYLRTYGELPFLKIAELFGKTESWARVTYHRAKNTIKEKLK